MIYSIIEVLNYFCAINQDKREANHYEGDKLGEKINMHCHGVESNGYKCSCIVTKPKFTLQHHI